jgi:hypothetical protein
MWREMLDVELAESEMDDFEKNVAGKATAGSGNAKLMAELIRPKRQTTDDSLCCTCQQGPPGPDGPPGAPGITRQKSEFETGK